MVILQVSSVASTYREVGRCQNDSAIIAQRLDQLKVRYPNKTVRAVDASTKQLVDFR